MNKISSNNKKYTVMEGFKKLKNEMRQFNIHANISENKSNMSILLFKIRNIIHPVFLIISR